METEKVKYPNRWKKGQSGNPNGRPKNAEAEELRIALREAAKEKNKTFLKHFVDRAYESDTVAIALARKIVADLFEGEGFENKTYIFKWKGDNEKLPVLQERVNTEDLVREA